MNEEAMRCQSAIRLIMFEIKGEDLVAVAISIQYFPALRCSKFRPATMLIMPRFMTMRLFVPQLPISDPRTLIFSDSELKELRRGTRSLLN